MSELIAEYWKKVGVNTTVKKTDWHPRRPTLHGQRAPGRSPAGRTRRSGPAPAGTTISRATTGGGYGHQWYTGGKHGEEPPKEIKDLYDNHMKFR